MALCKVREQSCRFVACRGTPHELYSDQGTNFKGGERELSEAFTAMQPTLQNQLARQNIQFLI